MRVLSVLPFVVALITPFAANAQFYDSETNIKGDTTITVSDAVQTTIVDGVSNKVNAGIGTIYEGTNIEGKTNITANDIVQTTIVNGVDNKVNAAIASVGAPKD